jgi:hypothetical protein
VVVGTEVGADPASDLGWQPVLWPLAPLLQLHRTTTDLAMATTGRDTTVPDLTPITAVRSITDRGTIAGEHLHTGKVKGPVNPGPFYRRRCLTEARPSCEHLKAVFVPKERRKDHRIGAATAPDARA